MAHAAEKTLVTVERLYEGCLFDNEELAAGALSALYIEAIALAITLWIGTKRSSWA